MRAQGEKILLIIYGIVALAVVASIVAIRSFDVNSYKSKIEVAASDATGLDVRIDGKIGLSFTPFGVSAHDIHISSKGKEIIFLRKLKIEFELMSVLRREFKITGCQLIRPVITIVKSTGGKYNFEGPKRKSIMGGPGATFSMNELKIAEGTLVYLDKKTNKKTELKDLSLTLKNFSIKNAGGDIIRGISFTGNLNCKEVLQEDLRIGNLKAPVKAHSGVFSLIPLSMDVFGGSGEGDATADLSEAATVNKINVKISKLDFKRLAESFGIKKAIGGKGDLVASLEIKASRNLMSGMNGDFSLWGDNLVIYTVDLDKVLSKYETTQKFNLVDLGALFIAGPLGAAAVKGYNYGDVYSQTRGGRGIIKSFVSHWKIKNGVATATDCALATYHHRVALKGKFDLVSERYNNVVVALLDDKGCAKFTQRINGPFGNPQVGVVTPVQSLAGPILNLFRKIKGFVQGGRCEIFYNGSVQSKKTK